MGRVLRLQQGARDVYRAESARQSGTRTTTFSRGSQVFAPAARSDQTARGKRARPRSRLHLRRASPVSEDAKLTRDVEDFIVKEHSNAEWATKVVGDRLLSIYAQMNDEYLRERGSDIEDVIQRLLANLTGEGLRYPNLSEDAVIVSPDLLPSTVAELDLNHVKAIATDSGGWTRTWPSSRGFGADGRGRAA